MNTRLLFIITAIFEFSVGIALILIPSLTAELLLGQAQTTTPGLVVSRLAGAALITLSVACFRTVDSIDSIAGKAILEAMLIYNILALALLLYVIFSMQFSVLLLFAIITHFLLMIWCALVLQKGR